MHNEQLLAKQLLELVETKILGFADTDDFKDVIDCFYRQWLLSNIEISAQERIDGVLFHETITKFFNDLEEYRNSYHPNPEKAAKIVYAWWSWNNMEDDINLLKEMFHEHYVSLSDQCYGEARQVLFINIYEQLIDVIIPTIKKCYEQAQTETAYR